MRHRLGRIRLGGQEAQVKQARGTELCNHEVQAR